MNLWTFYTLLQPYGYLKRRCDHTENPKPLSKSELIAATTKHNANVINTDDNQFCEHDDRYFKRKMFAARKEHKNRKLNS